MKSKQLLSIEQMQHLQELGLELDYDTLYRYVKFEDSDWILKPFSDLNIIGISFKYIPAYTLQDVLDALPKEINSRTRRFWLRIDLDDECLYYYYDNYNLVEIRKIMFGYNEMEELIDAAYEMLCWCIEQGHVKTGKEGKE